METLKDIRPMLFSKRLKIEKEFLEYAGKNHIVNAPMNVIAFINKDIVFKEDLKSKAIEWIKDLWLNKMDDSILVKELKLDSIGRVEAAVKILMKFFDITEDDLK